MSQYTHYPVSGAGGGGVSSLNSLTGALTLAAGTGISITPSGGDTLTIATTGGVPGGSSGQVQYNNAGAFGGFGSWNGTTLAITGAISATTTVAVGTNLHVFGTSILAGDMAVQGGANFSGNLGFYGASEIAQPSGNIFTALTNLGLVTSPSLALTNLPAQASNTILGNNTGGSATPTALSVAQVNAILPVFTSVLNGLVPLSGGGTANFLRADGTFAAPAGTAGITALTGDGAATGPGSVALTLATVNANVGSFGSATQVAAFTVNAKGLTTAASNVSIQIAESQVTGLVADLAAKQVGPLTGDVTTSSAASAAATLATVNSNVGSFTAANITVNAKGLVTAASNGAATVTYYPPTYQEFLSGSGTYNLNYTFVITSGNATVGATYTNNGVTFTVYATVASATVVVMRGSGPPAASGTLTKASGTGDATLTFSTFKPPVYLEVEFCGGGGGGAGSGSASATSGGTGGTTTFGSSLLTATGGGGGNNPTTVNGNGGAGGSATIASPATGRPASGGGGGGMPTATGAGGGNTGGGAGGNNPIFGGGAPGIFGANAGAAGTANTGGGGSGAGASGVLISPGGGGGAGGGGRAIIPNPSATYAFSCGASGTAGGAGTGGNAGGLGGSSAIAVWEKYQ